jgi:hypothetical protein
LLFTTAQGTGKLPVPFFETREQGVDELEGFLSVGERWIWSRNIEELLEISSKTPTA